MEELAQEDSHGVRLRLTARTCAALSRLNIFIGYHERCPPEAGRSIYIPKAARFEEYTSFLGDFHTIGAFSYVETPSLKADIGRYCSIANQVAVFGERHPIERVTSSPITYCFAANWNKPQFLRAHRALLGGQHQPDFVGMRPFVRPIVQHDVWIGQHVQLAQGITIGTGAVIGAGAVVTEDVAPYTIVGGNPARPIRDRFASTVSERLLAAQWWQYDPNTLWRFMYRDPAGFCDRFEEAARHGKLSLFQVRGLDWRDVLTEIGLEHEDAAATNTPEQPRTLTTNFGTTVFADPVLGMRHSPDLAVSTRVILYTEGLNVRLDCPGWTDGNRRPLDPQCDPSLVLGEFQKVPGSGGGFGLQRGGLFLCAEPDGRVSLSRPQLGPWECFKNGTAVSG